MERSNMAYRIGRHVVKSLLAQVVFGTKYRRDLADRNAICSQRVSFGKVAAYSEEHICARSGEADHVDRVIKYTPTLQFSKVLNSILGCWSVDLAERPP